MHSDSQAAVICFRFFWVCLIPSSCHSSAANTASCFDFWVATRWISLLNSLYCHFLTISSLHDLVAAAADMSGALFEMMVQITQFGIAFYLTWQGGRDTGDSGFLIYFSIRLILATFVRFCVTISHCPKSSYSPSAAKYLSSCVRLFFFHFTRSSLLKLLSVKFRSL